MAGGLLNLVAGGNQSVLIYGNPQKTYWTSTYKCITNFGLQNFRIDYSGLRQLSLTSPSTYVFKVKRYADLLMDTVLSINIPDIYSPLHMCEIPYEFKWIKNLGAMMIQTIRFTIGGNLIQEMTGYDIVTYANRDLTSTQKAKWDVMVGNTIDFYDPAYAFDRPGLYPNAVYIDSLGSEPSIRGRQLRIPIPIWWGLNSQQAFPLISLQYNELQIEVVLRPIQELYTIRDITGLNTTKRIAPSMTIREHQLFYFIQQPPECIYELFPTSWNENIHISATYGFLSEQEQMVFATSQQHYLIREYRHTWFYNINTSDKVWLQNSTGLVLNWSLLFQRSDVKERNEWSNFTNWAYDYLPNNIVNPCVCGDPDYWISGPLRSENVKDIPLTIGILLDGIYREETRPATMYEKDQQYLTSLGSGYVTLPGLYAYNFCLHTSPFQLQPSGAMDLTVYSKIELELTTIQPPSNPDASYMVVCDPLTGSQLGVNKTNVQIYLYNYNLLVLEERYNVIRFVGGNAALMNAR
jgi:hypothetical protein